MRRQVKRKLEETTEVFAPLTDAEWSDLPAFLKVASGANDARLWRSFHGRPPFCRREWCRIVRLGGRIASHICFVPRDMRIGSAVIRAGAVGYVATHPDHRRRGFASALLEAWATEAAAQGYHLAYLHGIPDFYERFGYRHVLPDDLRDPAVCIEPTGFDCPRVTMRVRPFRESDICALVDLYQEDNRERSGTIVRCGAYWKWLLGGLARRGWVRPEDILVVERAGGSAAGYAMVNPCDRGRFVVWEVAVQGRQAMRALLAAVVDRARCAGSDPIHVRAPLDHPFVATCLSAGARVTGYSDGVFGRLLDLDGLFRELGPELEARLARSPFREWTGTVRLKTDIGTVKLPFNQGELQPAGTPRPERSAVMSQSWLARLITGYNDVAVVGRPRDTDVAERDWPLIRALFPKACPYIWAADGGY